ncbi:hypothetical protein Axi01nite_42870 [Actinoplanes xinjiangensis]|nr:hypothetical protein Axi01nite_42870 [Actinoplanes xinjiangensis]
MTPAAPGLGAAGAAPRRGSTNRFHADGTTNVSEPTTSVTGPTPQVWFHDDALNPSDPHRQKRGRIRGVRTTVDAGFAVDRSGAVGAGRAGGRPAPMPRRNAGLRAAGGS